MANRLRAVPALEPVPCRACGGPGPLRRGRCAGCYEEWLSTRPVGVGAACANCGNRRLAQLRYFELHRFWVVLCHNCTASAQALAPMPRSVDGLCAALKRNRRRGDRRKDKEGYWYGPAERRRKDRRATERDDILDATGLVVEIEAEFGSPSEDEEPQGGPITSVHQKIPEADLR